MVSLDIQEALEDLVTSGEASVMTGGKRRRGTKSL